MKEMDLIDNVHKFTMDVIVFLLTLIKSKLLVVLTTVMSLKLVSILMNAIARPTYYCESRLSYDKYRFFGAGMINTKKMDTNPIAIKFSNYLIGFTLPVMRENELYEC